MAVGLQGLVMVMRDAPPLTIEEIAERAGLSPHTVRAALNAAPLLFEKAGKSGKKTLWRVRPGAEYLPVATRRLTGTGSTSWRTPRALFEAVQSYLGVVCTIDGAANADNALVDVWIEDADRQHPREGDVVWCNPPWRGLRLWAERFLRWLEDYGAAGVVALLPSATDTNWFARLWESGHLAEVLLITPRVAYERADGTVGRAPTLGSMVCYLVPDYVEPTVRLVRWDGRALKDVRPPYRAVPEQAAV